MFEKRAIPLLSKMRYAEAVLRFGAWNIARRIVVGKPTINGPGCPIQLNRVSQTALKDHGFIVVRDVAQDCDLRRKTDGHRGCYRFNSRTVCCASESSSSEFGLGSDRAAR